LVVRRLVAFGDWSHFRKFGDLSFGEWSFEDWSFGDWSFGEWSFGDWSVYQNSATVQYTLIGNKTEKRKRLDDKSVLL
jgi:hypothetical protein